MCIFQDTRVLHILILYIFYDEGKENVLLKLSSFCFIGHAETAHNRIASVVLGFKEALLEEAEKKKDKRKYVTIICTNVFFSFVLFL